MQVQKDNDGLYFYGHDSVDFDTFKQNIILSAQVATGNITFAEAQQIDGFVYMYDVTKIPIPNRSFATTNQKGILSVVRPGEEDTRTRVPQFTGVGSNTIRDQNTANIAAERGLTLNEEASQKEGRAVFDNQTRTNNNTDGVFNDGLSTEIENDNSEINNVVNNGENVEEETNLDVEVEPVDTNKANRVSGAVLKKLIDSNVVTFSAGSYVDDDGFVYIPNEPITVETKVGNKPLIENNKNVFEQDPIDEGGYVKSISPSVFERLQQQKLIKTVEKDGNTLYENVMSGELYQVRGELQNQNIRSDIPDEVKVAPGFDANDIQNRVRSDVSTGLGAKDGDFIAMSPTEKNNVKQRLTKMIKDVDVTKIPQNKIQEMLLEVGFSPREARILAAVAMAESRGDATIDTVKSGLDPNKENEFSIGLFQINMDDRFKEQRLKLFGINSIDELYDPIVNVMAAKAVYDERGGGENGLKAWSTYEFGKYKDFLSDRTPPG